MPDLERIKKHLSALLSDLKNLEKHNNITSEDIAKDTDLLWILERGIYLSIQKIFDYWAFSSIAIGPSAILGTLDDGSFGFTTIFLNFRIKVGTSL